ncbi:CDP-glycerol glycerophosphotransferase family protein [Aliivibrio fischeri]|uniref:CDP-glycerol glycerophosphotransferase family protein n=1 Tax=Aliivibrio fischeri TaxID=668 RepID=UPI0007C52F2E|nr:CDP-glycerol glycerophosphotransferase family protein [Aliivibrio fischeri]
MLKIIVATFVRIFTLLFKRDDKLIIVGSWFGDRYADNSRYFFEYMDNIKDFKTIWVTKNDKVFNEVKSTGRHVIKVGTIISLYYHLRAKYFVFDQSINDVDSKYTRGAIRINLWHGIPLKKIGKMVKGSNFNQSDNRLKDFIFGKTKDYLVSPSEFSDDIFKKCFDKEIIRGPYFRVSYLKDELWKRVETKESIMLEEIKKKNKKILFYLPTFRDNSRLQFLGGGDYSNFLKNIEQKGYVFITKLHYAEGLFHGENESLHGIINLPDDYDVYPFLKETNILITDYSSVYFDFLSLDREIIFYPYDLDFYEKKDRGFAISYKEHTPGHKVFNINDLLNTIDAIELGKINYSNEREKLNQKIWFENQELTFLKEIRKLK